MYEYKAAVVKVVDGDTFDADVDVGFYVTMRLRLRLVGVDTAELNSKDPTERELANKAKLFVEQALMADPKPAIIIKTSKADSFGRWLAAVTYTVQDSTKNLAEELLANGYAVPYKP